MGNNVTIAKFTSIQCTGVIHELGTGVTIGDNSAVGAYSFLGGQGGITIGNNVIMGPKVNIFSENHGFNRFSLYQFAFNQPFERVLSLMTIVGLVQTAQFWPVFILVRAV